jgi:antitoxin FitA
MYNARMTRNLQVRDVPDAVHAALTAMAAEAGMSVNRFMLAELERIARRGRNAELLRAAAERGGRRATSDEIVEAIREERASR